MASHRCGHFQTKFKLASHQLLANTSPVQGVMLCIVGPYLDQLLTGKWIGAWEASAPGMEVSVVLRGWAQGNGGRDKEQGAGRAGPEGWRLGHWALCQSGELVTWLGARQ